MAEEQEDPENEDKLLIGVNLITSNNIHGQQTSLGVVISAKSCIQTKYVGHLRQLVFDKIPTLPSNFTFCTQQGWSLTKELEDSIRIKDILSENGAVYIQRCFEKPKIGIKTVSGKALGFIFVEYKMLLNQTREIIDQQVLKDRRYWFIDPNGWPLSSVQESQFCVIDIINGSCLHVDGDFPSSSTCSSPDLNSPPHKRICTSLIGTRNLSFRTSKDLERCQMADSSVSNEQSAKQLLISYVRADAAHHAVELKQELSHLGFSVYLDVHEIQSGVDWQDSLNFAVSTCEVFIPLVTPRYGETQWTNREVKLADVLGKIILPVSFLEEWPPRCLGIQFATTQYINWKTPAQIHTELAEGLGEKATDIRFWDNRYIKMVAMEIGERLDGFLDLNISRVPSLTRRKTVVKSCACVEESNPLALTTDREGYPLIVICVHPQQNNYGNELKTWLEEQKYEVWCSTELDINYPDSLPNSQEGYSLSQLSQYGTPTDLERENRQKFQEKADEAGIIVFVVSKDFIQSKTCQQQLFYCEQRKRVIPLRYEVFDCPGWMSMLIGNDSWEDVSHANFRISLLNRLRRKLDPLTRDTATDDIKEAKIAFNVRQLKKSISTDNCVYIAGSTEFHCDKSEDICGQIGHHLASMDSVTLVTGGFYGVGESVGHAFYEETRDCGKHMKCGISYQRETQWFARNKQAAQNEDGSFQTINYGKTLFCGDCVQERETIAARTFDICILIEGGPGAAHEAEEFSWNDHIVIPIQCTGGAASGDFNVPRKIFEVPQCVREDDWLLLSDTDSTADSIGQAVKQIVCCLQGKLNQENVKFDISPKLKSPKSALKSSPKGQKTSLTSMKTVII